MSPSPRRAPRRSPRRAPDPTPLSPADPAFPQARARETYRALLDAAREVFAARGFDGAQTPDIAAKAGVSVGTFYRYFPDKRHIFVEMLRLHLAEVNARVMARLTPERFAVGAAGSGEGAGAARREAIDLVLEVLFAQVRRLPALERVYLEMSLRDPEVAAIRDTFEGQAEGVLAALIQQLVPRSVVADPRAAAYVVQRAALEVALAEAGVRGGTRRLGERAARLALRELIHRYLFPEGGGAREQRAGRTRRRRSR